MQHRKLTRRRMANAAKQHESASLAAIQAAGLVEVVERPVAWQPARERLISPVRRSSFPVDLGLGALAEALREAGLA